MFSIYALYSLKTVIILTKTANYYQCVAWAVSHLAHKTQTRACSQGHSGKMSARALTRSRHFRGRAQAERLDSRETIREKMVAIQKFLSYVFISRR